MPTQKEIDAALKAIVEARERNDAMGRRYPSQEDEIRTVLAAAEKARNLARTPGVNETLTEANSA
jgi:hypothetical protein